MLITNQLKLKLEDYEKCYLLCDSDCALGQLYDFSCALQSFILGKMKENEEKMAANKSSPEPKE
jgi:hypothetical protein